MQYLNLNNLEQYKEKLKKLSPSELSALLMSNKNDYSLDNLNSYDRHRLEHSIDLTRRANQMATMLSI